MFVNYDKMKELCPEIELPSMDRPYHGDSASAPGAMSFCAEDGGSGGGEVHTMAMVIGADGSSQPEGGGDQPVLCGTTA